MAVNNIKIGKFEVVDVLGKGGMGVVYKAQDPRIGRLVAIKMMTGNFAENPDLLARFYREAQATGQLQHPNIVTVYDVSDQDGQPYIVMQFLEGEALDKTIAARKQISLIEKLEIIIQACNGLHYAHQHGIVHRDIKPANIIILADGTAKIVDFGIARLGDNSMTRTGQLIGTLFYMSPEQIGGKLVDRRTDIWSTAVMLYELLAGTLPFEAPDTPSLLLKIINEQPPPLSKYLENVPGELEETILRALSKDRDDRYATAEDFAFDLSRVQEKMKRLLVDDQVVQAKALREKGELARSKDLLLQVLRLESRHTMAKDLLAEVNQLLQKQQRGEQVRQLRTHAEDAFTAEDFVAALSSLDQAISLDKTNAELLNFRSVVHETKVKREKIREAMRRAESAHQSGNLQSAIKLLDEALALDPQNSQVKAMHAAVASEAAEQEKQQKVQQLLDGARKEISSRKFTEAFSLLDQAQKLDPTAPEIDALRNMATSGRDQDRRRKDIAEATAAIEDALNSDDYQRALAKADEALQKLPNDAGLLKLKAMAEKQREAGEKRKFVEGQLAEARKLLDGQKPQDALVQLEKAAAKAPGDPKLASLIAFVRETIERQEVEEKKQKAVTAAKEALRKKDFAAAIRILETANAELEGQQEIADMLGFAREEAAQHKRRGIVEQASAEAQQAISEREYEKAIAGLQAALKDAPGDEELTLLVQQAQRHQKDEQSKVDTAIGKAQRLMDGKKFEEAVALLESQPKHFARSAAFIAVLEKARGEQEKVQAIASAVAKVREHIGRNELSAATGIIQGATTTYGDAAELKEAAKEVETKRVGMARSAVEKAIKDARMLLVTRQYGAIMKVLDNAKDFLPHVAPDLKAQLESVRKEVTTAIERQQKSAALDKSMEEASTAAGGETIVDGSYTMVEEDKPAKGKRVDVPGTSPGTSAGAARARTVVEPGPMPVRAPAPIPVPAPVPATKKFGALAIGGVVALLVMIGAFAVYKQFFGAVPATAQVQVNAIPYGHVKYLETANGRRINVERDTPLVIMVAPGEYKIVVVDAAGQTHEGKVKAGNDDPGIYNEVFTPVDVKSLVEQSK